MPLSGHPTNHADRLDVYKRQIYGTEASPFREQFEWGTITRKGNTLYLILSGNRPADGKITLTIPGCKLQKADIKEIQKGQEMIFTLPADAYRCV